MVNRYLRCGKCKARVAEYKMPSLACDVIIDCVNDEKNGIVLIKRRNYPFGWAIPGGFIDYGESVEKCAKREAFEETSLKVTGLKQFRVYSNPGRDPRHHTVSVVFTARAKGIPKAMDDAKEAGIFAQESLPKQIAFDHKRILKEYFRIKQTCRNSGIKENKNSPRVRKTRISRAYKGMGVSKGGIMGRRRCLK